jgi:transcriptional regulator with XRE-family HTH domain
MYLIHIFASNVKKYRLEKGLSQEQLAEKAKLHRTYISAIERERRNISIDNIQKISEALDIEPYLLFMNLEEDVTHGKKNS